MANSTAPSGNRGALVSALLASASLLAGCASNPAVQRTASDDPNLRVERVVGPNDKVAPGGGRAQIGKPYTIGGRTYVPREDPTLDQVGLASWYGGDFHHGTKTANGEVFDRHTISAAHTTMPLPAYARVTSLATGRSIIVRVNDRGPYAANRIIDLSERTAQLLDIKNRGVSKVRVQYVGRAGLAGSDQRVLAATLRGPGLAPGQDERTLLASADIQAGPRRQIPASTLVADASLAAPASSVVAPRPGAIGPARAWTADAYAFELAGVDASALRAASKSRPLKPASSSAEVIAADMPAADGAPLSILPAASGSSSYADDGRIAATHAIFARVDEGARSE